MQKIPVSKFQTWLAKQPKNKLLDSYVSEYTDGSSRYPDEAAYIKMKLPEKCFDVFLWDGYVEGRTFQYEAISNCCPSCRGKGPIATWFITAKYPMSKERKQ